MSDEEAFAIVNQRLAEADHINVDLLGETFKHYGIITHMYTKEVTSRFVATIDYNDSAVNIKVENIPV